MCFSGLRLRILVSAALVLSAAGVAGGDTFDDRFARFDTAHWEAVNCTPEVLPDGGGLRLRIPPGGAEVAIRHKLLWEDMFDFQLEYDLVDPPDLARVILRLDNPEARRRVDLDGYVRHYVREKVTRSYCALRYYKDGKPAGARDTSVLGITRRMRLIKDGGPDVFSFQGRLGGGWAGPAGYPWRAMHLDKNIGYHASIIFSVPKQKKPVDVILRRFHVWNSLYRAEGRKPGEMQYCRAHDEPEKDPKVWRFDFGPVGQQLERLHLPVTQWSMYDPRRGWGWITDLEPRRGAWPHMSNEDAVKFGLAPTKNGGWRRNSDMAKNYVMAHKKRYLMSVNHGGNYIQFFKKWMDLKIPCERDMVFAKRPYGFPLDRRNEADQWERRASIYVPDDLETQFVVELPNDRYTLLIGVGYNEGGFHGCNSQFILEAEGVPVKKSLANNWRRCRMFQADDVEVNDGQLTITLRANRRMAMNRVDVWDLGVSWQINYLVALPSDDRDAIKAEQWRLINDRGRKVRQITFVPGEPMQAWVHRNHLVVDSKPSLPMMWQAFHSDAQMHYPYYLWGNTMATIQVGWHFRGSSHFMQADWVRLSAADDYPWREINALNLAHTWGSSTLLRVSGFLNFMPRAIAGEGGAVQDARGRTNRWNVSPPLNSRLEREIQKEAYTMVSQQLKLHPNIYGHYMYEEFWHPKNVGYDHRSINQFHIWLTEKYKTIDALNREWGTTYADFSDIKPPPQSEESACWVNFRRFRMYAQQQTIKYPRDLLKELEPNRVTFGAKGDYATASWYYADDIELFGWYGPNTARGAAYHFGQVPMVGGEMFGCRWGWDDGRKQLDHKPAYPKKYRNPGAGNEYNHYMTKISRGARGFYNEEYNDGIQHMFHRTRMIENGHRSGTIRLWYGALAQFDDEAFEGPDVFVSEPALKCTRWMAWAYRNAHLWLPTRVPLPKVAVVSTDESYYELPGTGKLFETQHIESLLEQIEMPVDILRSGRFDDYPKYKVLIVGGFSEMLRPGQAEKVKQFVRSGGKVLWLTRGGNRSGIDLKLGREMPRFALTELTGCEFKNGEEVGLKPNVPIQIVPNPVTPSITEPIHVGNTDRKGLVIVPKKKGCTVLARAGNVPYAVASPDRSVITVNLTLGLPRWMRSNVHRAKQRALQQKLRTFLSDIVLGAWKIDPGFEIEGAADLAEFDGGVLEGEGYSLVTVINNSKTDQEVTAKPGLRPGRYDLIDITGRRPIVVKKSDGARTLDPDLNQLRPTVLKEDIAHDALRREGLKLKVPSRQTRVILARPAGTEVGVNIADYYLTSRCGRPLRIVVGDDAPKAEHDAADRIRKFLVSREVPVELVKASEVAVVEKRHEIRVNPHDGKKRRSSRPDQQDDWFLVETFVNRPVETDRNLLCVGSEKTNALIAHFAAPGTFVYDKISEDVTADYPGPGRGVIQVVDSVNFPYYQSNRDTRDAILVGGSDPAGTAKAVDKLLAMIRDLPTYVPPAVDEKMEIDDTPDEAEKRRLKKP